MEKYSDDKGEGWVSDGN